MSSVWKPFRLAWRRRSGIQHCPNKVLPCVKLLLSAELPHNVLVPMNVQHERHSYERYRALYIWSQVAKTHLDWPNCRLKCLWVFEIRVMVRISACVCRRLTVSTFRACSDALAVCFRHCCLGRTLLLKSDSLRAAHNSPGLAALTC